MTLSSITFLLFAAFSSIRIFSYLPQIRKVASDMHGATAISYSTWGLWTAANVATAAYALVNLGDTYLALVSALYAGCCVAVIGLTVTKRRGLSRRQAREPEQASSSEPPALLASLRNCAEAEASALLTGGPRNPQFEREIAAHSRRVAYHDFMRYVRPRLKSLSKGAADAFPRNARVEV
jgi:hypothetical protein